MVAASLAKVAAAYEVHPDNLRGVAMRTLACTDFLVMHCVVHVFRDLRMQKYSYIIIVCCHAIKVGGNLYVYKYMCIQYRNLAHANNIAVLDTNNIPPPLALLSFSSSRSEITWNHSKPFRDITEMGMHFVTHVGCDDIESPCGLQTGCECELSSRE